jgi:alpha-2-macroglobulin
MPVFALAYLHDAVVAKGEPETARAKELRRRMKNAILTEAGASHVEELSDPYLLFFWSSNVRSSGIVLGSLVRAGGEPAVIRSMVRGLLDVRKNGRWGNTQENAVALEALVDYYRKFESEAPNFKADVAFAGAPIFDAEFRQRNTVERSSDTPMQQLLRTAPAGTEVPLTFHKEGAGTLFYNARLTYASNALSLGALDNGMTVERVYTPQGAPEGTSVTTYKAGDTLRVTLTMRLTKERTFVAVNDPLPAGFEAVETLFQTTGRADSEAAGDDSFEHEPQDWTWTWRSGGFDHVERHDDKVRLFATRLGAGVHRYTYTVRATTSGTFRVAPTRIEQMYRPEVWGRSESAVVEVK